MPAEPTTNKASFISFGWSNAFVTALSVSACVAVLLFLSGILNRVELQHINRLFEARRWLVWSDRSINRFNWKSIAQYHQEHEIPRAWWAWDYTLSWLLENNHPPVKHQFVIFNHMLDDEPPAEAVTVHPWMEPLMHYPTSRKAIAEVVDFLAQHGARAIILDNDFPQYSENDMELANAIHNAASGKTAGHPVPVLMAETVNRRSFGNAMQLDASTTPVGVLEQLRKLEPGVNVEAKYTGTTSIALDEDQVVRRLLTRASDPLGIKWTVSLPVKLLYEIGEQVPPDLPHLMDINFISGPNSELYPVRPFSYLLDPDKKKIVASGGTPDVCIKNAIVILGDGITDRYPTPNANVGVDLMSGSEILAHTIDTISRHDWPIRLTAGQRLLYLLACCAITSLLIIWTQDWRDNVCANLAPWLYSLAFKDEDALGMRRACTATVRLIMDFCSLGFIICCPWWCSCCVFAATGIIVPAVIPCVASACGALAATIVERESARIIALTAKLNGAQLQLAAERQQHEAELKLQEARAQTMEAIADQRRRKEFVRRVNHDLKAPVTVLNWTLAKLKREGLNSHKAPERVEHITRTADRLFDLMAELVRTYDATSAGGHDEKPLEILDARFLLSECIRMQYPLAEEKSGRIEFDMPPYPLPVKASRLELCRVFDNLIRNAFLHNPPNTALEIVGRRRGNTNQIVFTDNGRGIAPEDLRKIFQEGFSSDNDDDDNSQRSEGLGLTIAQTIVESVGGTISVESEEEIGTTFTIALPIAEGSVHDNVVVPLRASRKA